MTHIVHARLDEATVGLLRRLHRRTGLNHSEIIRRGLRAMENGAPAPPSRRIVGLGMFRSGVPDLGSNKKHLEGYGR